METKVAIGIRLPQPPWPSLPHSSTQPTECKSCLTYPFFPFLLTLPPPPPTNSLPFQTPTVYQHSPLLFLFNPPTLSPLITTPSNNHHHQLHHHHHHQPHQSSMSRLWEYGGPQGKPWGRMAQAGVGRSGGVHCAAHPGVLFPHSHPKLHQPHSVRVCGGASHPPARSQQASP